MTLTNKTPLTFEYPDRGTSAETTWGEFSTVNRDDPDMLADVAEQITANNYAEIGGGAAPVIWIFPSTRLADEQIEAFERQAAADERALIEAA